MVALFLVIMAAKEWVQYLLKPPPTPYILSMVALIAIGYAVYRWRKTTGELHAIRLGRQGEETVGQFLEEKLRPAGFQVIHDLQGKGFNVDHVVIGDTGIFSIETKTHSKPANRTASVQYDGHTVTVDGHTPDRNPVEQAKAQAAWLRDLLEKSTGKNLPVQPIVIYPGWFVERQPAGVDIWVLNEKAAVSFMVGAKQQLQPEDVSLVTFHLKRYVNAGSEKSP